MEELVTLLRDISARLGLHPASFDTLLRRAEDPRWRRDVHRLASDIGIAMAMAPLIDEEK